MMNIFKINFNCTNFLILNEIIFCCNGTFYNPQGSVYAVKHTVNTLTKTHFTSPSFLVTVALKFPNTAVVFSPADLKAVSVF